MVKSRSMHSPYPYTVTWKIKGKKQFRKISCFLFEKNYCTAGVFKQVWNTNTSFKNIEVFVLVLLLWFLFFVYLFFGHVHGMWWFLGQESKLCHSSHLSHNNDNASFLTARPLANTNVLMITSTTNYRFLFPYLISQMHRNFLIPEINVW